MKKLLCLLSLISLFLICSCSKDEKIESNIKIVDDLSYSFVDDKLYITGYVGEENNIVIKSSYTIDNKEYDVYGISSDSFRGDKSNIKSIKIEEGIKYIGDRAFAYSNIKTVLVPSTLESVGTDVFYNASTDFNEYENGYYLGNNDNKYVCLLGTNSKEEEKFVINDNTKIIKERAFANNKIIKEITLPKGIKYLCNYCLAQMASLEKVDMSSCDDVEIGKSIFSSNANLKELKLPTKLDSIPDSFMADCTSITSLTLPDGITSIGTGAFSNCSDLTTINIPTSVKSIGVNAFGRDSNLTNMTFENLENWYYDDYAYTIEYHGQKEIPLDVSKASSIGYDIATKYWMNPIYKK